LLLSILQALKCDITSAFLAIESFDSAAKRRKGTVAWFYGFNLHLLINHIGEIIPFHLEFLSPQSSLYDIFSLLTYPLALLTLYQDFYISLA